MQHLSSYTKRVDIQLKLIELIQTQRIKEGIESPIEAIFYYSIINQLNDNVQVKLQDKFGKYRADVSFSVGRYKLIVELDGKAYHEESRDIVRDKYIMENFGVNKIVRFSGYSVNNQMDFILKSICYIEPLLFKTNCLIKECLKSDLLYKNIYHKLVLPNYISTQTININEIDKFSYTLRTKGHLQGWMNLKIN